MGLYTDLLKDQERSPKRPERKGKERKIARLQERKIARLQDEVDPNMMRFIYSFLDEKAGGTTSFRYPERLLKILKKLKNLVYDKYDKDVTKTSVVVAALAYVIWDFQQNGKRSLLYKMLVDTRR